MDDVAPPVGSEDLGTIEIVDPVEIPEIAEDPYLSLDAKKKLQEKKLQELKAVASSLQRMNTADIEAEQAPKT